MNNQTLNKNLKGIGKWRNWNIFRSIMTKIAGSTAAMICAISKLGLWTIVLPAIIGSVA
jgi:hypothetical protein